MSKKLKDGISTLDSYSNIIRQQGEDRRRKADEYLEQVRTDLPSWIAELPRLDKETLLNGYDNALSRGYGDTRVIELLQQFKDAVKAEILRRMR